MSLTRFSWASASAWMITAWRVRSASSTTRRRLMLSSCSATVFSTAMRSRTTSAIERFSPSTSLSLEMRDSSVSRSREMTSSMRSFSIRSLSMAMTRSRFLAATAISRAWFSCWMPSCSWVRRSAAWALSRSSARTRAISASSRARMVSTSRFCLISASAWRRSSSRMASRASTFWRVISFSSCRWNSLVRTCSIAVSSVIFRMPWASRMLAGSSLLSGVCSR